MKKIVLGISGASGMPLAVRLLHILKQNADVEVHLVMSRGASITIEQELSMSLKEVEELADVVYNIQDIGASIASGTFETDGMIIIPCSMKTIAGIASGYSDNLLLRACDVMIKEQRKLILVARESPLSPIHLQHLTDLSRLQNVMILPPVLTYYNHPQSIEDMEVHLVGKILSKFQINVKNYKPWK